MEYNFSEKLKNLKPSAIREILKFASTPGMIPFSAGNPAPEAFPVKELAALASEILAAEPITALQYGITEGYGPLIDTLRDFLKRNYDIGTPDDAILITGGGQQVMELAAKVFCNEGDTILVEEPSFIGSLNSFRSLGARLKGVPLMADGADVDALESILKTEKNVKLFYIIPTYQNPTGSVTSPEKRARIYELAREYDFMIVEDNPYGDLYYDGKYMRTIKADDADGRVIYAGSFSKVIAPGLRVGYCCANREVVAKMTVAKQGEDVHNSMLPQMLCHGYMTKYDFNAHLAELRAIYSKKAELCRDLADEHLVPHGVTYYPIRGGLFMWLTLPESIHMNEFCMIAVRER